MHGQINRATCDFIKRRHEFLRTVCVLLSSLRDAFGRLCNAHAVTVHNAVGGWAKRVGHIRKHGPTAWANGAVRNRDVSSIVCIAVYVRMYVMLTC